MDKRDKGGKEAEQQMEMEQQTAESMDRRKRHRPRNTLTTQHNTTIPYDTSASCDYTAFRYYIFPLFRNRSWKLHFRPVHQRHVSFFASNVLWERSERLRWEIIDE